MQFAMNICLLVTGPSTLQLAFKMIIIICLQDTNLLSQLNYAVYLALICPISELSFEVCVGSVMVHNIGAKSNLMFLNVSLP